MWVWRLSIISGDSWSVDSGILNLTVENLNLLDVNSVVSLGSAMSLDSDGEPYMACLPPSSGYLDQTAAAEAKRSMIDQLDSSALKPHQYCAIEAAQVSVSYNFAATWFITATIQMLTLEMLIPGLRTVMS